MAQAKRKAKQAQVRSRRQLPVWKKLMFSCLVTVFVFGTLEVVLWLAGVAPAWVQEDPFAGFSRHIPHFTEDVTGGSGVVMTVSPAKGSVLNAQRFPAEKPGGVYRIVCLGGSTTYGRPFYDQTSFPGWLRVLLPAADPSRQWEVINAGGISYASYRVLGVMEELAEYAPDLFIVYTGQNEFLEHRTYDNDTGTSALAGPLSLLFRMRTTTVVRSVLEAAGVRSPASRAREAQLGEDTKAIPVNAVGPEAYQRDETLSRDIVAHFQATLRKMIQTATDASADILFVVPASNLADFAPFRSQHREGLSDQDLSEWIRAESLARSLRAQQKSGDALKQIDRALAIDDRHAGLWYLKGQTLLALGRFDEARTALVRAVDEDVCPLRAITPLVQSVRDMAEEPGATVVDFARLVESNAEHGIPGDDLFHDHVHPTIEANRMLALRILEQLEASGILRPEPGWKESRLTQVTEQLLAGIDRDLHARQLRALAALLTWLGQPESARTQAELSLELSGRSESALLELAKGLQANKGTELAQHYYQEAVAANPKSVQAHLALARSAQAAGQTDLGITHLRKAVELSPMDVAALEQLGVALAMQGQLTEAEQYLSTAAATATPPATVFSNLGLVIAKQGRFAEAMEHYQVALRMDANSSSTHFNTALACEQLGDISQARFHLQETIRLAKGHAEAEARLQVLSVR